MAARLLQSSLSTVVNNGIGFTYKILANGTVKLYLDVQISLANPQFSINIKDPSAIIATKSGVSLQNVQSILSVPKIDYYPPTEGISAKTNFPGKFASIIFLLLFALTMFFSDVMIRPLQMLQMLFLHCLIDSPAPANMYYLLQTLRLSTLNFVTNWFSGMFPSTIVYYDTPTKIYDTCIDYIFLRNVGQIFTLIVVMAVFAFIFLILSNKRIMCNKVWHSFFSEVSEKRFRWMALNDILSLFYVPITYFGFWQFHHLFGTGIYGFNGFVTLVFVLSTILLPIIYLILWCKRTP